MTDTDRTCDYCDNRASFRYTRGGQSHHACRDHEYAARQAANRDDTASNRGLRRPNTVR